MKNLYNILFISFSILTTSFFISCDKVEPPYKESQTDSDTTVSRKILLEEFTGHECPNCPYASLLAQQLKSVYGEKLIIISIHAGGFAVAEPSGPFTYNFTSNTGNTIHSFFHGDMLGYPMGMISRTGWQQNINLDKDAWSTRIETIKNDPPKITLEITNSYEQNTHALNTFVECDALMDFTGTYKICAYITEDSIIKPQQFPDSISYNYLHRHVLRDAMNSAWGDTLITNGTTVNTEFSKNFSTTLSSAWNENHCCVVVFVYDVSNYEIIQAEEKKIIIP